MINSKLLENLNSEQKKAVIHKNGPLLIIAGAGTGKTTVIAHRIAWLIEQKLAKPSEILALTFTDKAAREMDERILELVPYGVLDFTATTFHGFCKNVLEDYGIEVGLSPDFQLLNEAQQILLIRQNLEKFKLDLYKPISNPNKFIAALVKLFSRAKDELVSATDYEKLANSYQLKVPTPLGRDPDRSIGTKKDPKNLELIEEATLIKEQASAYTTYEKIKEQNCFFDFGDLIFKTHWMLKNRPFILKKLQHKFKYIFVDEFQDTNFAQAQIVYMLAKKQKNITVVGDDDQSIYKFRGASIANIMEFLKYYPKAKKIVLNHNYRSTKEILDASYKLIKNNNPNRLEVRAKVGKHLTSHKSGNNPQFWHFQNNAEEIEEIIKFISNGVNKGKKYGNFAILVRANSYGENFVEKLRDLGIPYQFIGSRGLYDREEIKELTSYLKILANPDNDIALFNILWAEQFAIEKVFLRRLVNWARQKNLSLFELIETLTKKEPDNENTPRLEKIISLIKNHLNIAKSMLTSKILIDYMQKSGMYQRIKNYNDYETLEKFENIKMFFKKIAEFEKVSQEKNLFAFIEHLNLIIEAGDNPPTHQADKYDDAINIMTIHAAKGLEFDTVFMPYLVHGRFPSRGRPEAIELPSELIKEAMPSGDIHTQEERRLFYVGLTRAKTELILSASDFYEGNVQTKRISNFASETIADKVHQKFVADKNLELFQKKVGKNNKILEHEIKELTLSPSALETYISCPKKFEYSHVFKIKSETSQSLSFGDSIHNTLSNYYKLIKNNQKLTGTEIEKLFANNWKDEGYSSKIEKERAYQKGLAAIQKFIKNNHSIPDYIEKRIILNINDDYKITGRIDRIDMNNDSVEIIDYKTSPARNKTNSEVRDNLPLMIYGLASKNLEQNKKIILSLFYVLDNKKISLEASEKKLIQIKEKIKQICDQIILSYNKHDFIAKPSEFSCHYCSYKSICPYKAKGA